MRGQVIARNDILKEKFALKWKEKPGLGIRSWGFRANRSFLVSDLSDSLTSLITKEEMSDSLIFSIKKSKKNILKTRF